VKLNTRKNYENSLCLSKAWLILVEHWENDKLKCGEFFCSKVTE